MFTRRTIHLCLAGAALLALGLVFLFLPLGWNLLPLPLIGLALFHLQAQWRLAATPKAKRRARRPAAVPEEPDEPPTPPAKLGNQRLADLLRRANRAFGPVLAGLIIDLVDLASFGPLGMLLGLPVGALLGYWLASALGATRRSAFLCALAAGIYCSLPFTTFLPLATLVGAWIRFQQSGRPKKRRPRQRRPARRKPPAAAAE